MLLRLWGAGAMNEGKQLLLRPGLEHSDQGQVSRWKLGLQARKQLGGIVIQDALNVQCLGNCLDWEGTGKGVWLQLEFGFLASV